MLRSVAARSLLLALAALAALAAPAAAVPTVSGEFDVPGLGSNGKLVQGPDGNMWATLGGPVNDVARITPEGAVTEYDLDAGIMGTSGIAVGPDLSLWVTYTNGLAKFNNAAPTTTVTKYTINAIAGNSPIVTGPDNSLWIATKDKLLRSGLAQPDEPFPVNVPGLDPKDIDVAGQLLVVADFGGSRVLTSTTAGVLGETKVGGGPQGVAGNPNGQYAFSQPTNEPREFGLLAPGAAPIITPVPGKDPFGVALGSDGAYWAPEFNSDGLLRVTATGVVTGVTGFAKGSAPRQIAAGPGNTLWVTLEMTKKIGRVSGLEPPLGPPPPPATIPTTKIAKGPKDVVKTTKNRAKVSFRFSSGDPAASFQCRLIALTPKGTGKKKPAAASKQAKIKLPAFKACKSPRSYRLKPGRYRFQVRAVNAAGADLTPAKRTFKVVRVFPID